MNSAILTANQEITRRFDLLQAADPLTLATFHGDRFDEEHQIRQIVADSAKELSSVNRERLEEEYFGAGPIAPLLTDPSITEIILNGKDSIWYERNGRLSRHDDHFFSPLTYRNFIARLSREAGVNTSLDIPFADGQWRGCRIHLIVPPAAGDEAILTLRRHPLNPWTLERLAEKNWSSPQALEQLQRLIAGKKNVLIIGCTGSGKTSVLNACLNAISPAERAIIIEDTSELHAPNAVSAKLLTRRDPQGQLREIDQSELLKQALRMRPDRLIMGEIRGAEAKDLLMAFATGHSGCLGTLHADSARQALLRLEMLVQLGAPQWNLHAVRSLILLSVHAIVVVGRTPNGDRCLEGIYRIASLEDIGFLIEKTI
jgi:pilus assembly protein CpaF